MTAPGGWRVVPIVVERDGRTLRLYRVTQHGAFVCECRTRGRGCRRRGTAGRVDPGVIAGWRL